MAADGLNGGPRFAGAVLAGGRSRRMGTDKAFVEVHGRPLVTVAANALRAAGADPVLAVGGDRAALRALGLSVVDDRWPGDGPLGGIITALESTPSSNLVVVLSCDLVAASPGAVGAVVAALDAADDADVAVPMVHGRAQWLHAAWRSSALPALHAAFATGIRAPRRATGHLVVTRVSGGDPEWFRDADAPTDLPGGAG